MKLVQYFKGGYKLLRIFSISRLVLYPDALDAGKKVVKHKIIYKINNTSVSELEQKPYSLARFRQIMRLPVREKNGQT